MEDFNSCPPIFNRYFLRQMSKSVWVFLGIASLIAGISLLLQAPSVFATRPPDKQLEFILGTAGLVGLCGVFAIACFFGVADSRDENDFA